jgi:hypothetical protein
MVAAGMPDTSTTGLGAVGTAWPPCEQSTVAPTCRIGAGIFSLPLSGIGLWHMKNTQLDDS